MYYSKFKKLQLLTPEQMQEALFELLSETPGPADQKYVVIVQLDNGDMFYHRCFGCYSHSEARIRAVSAHIDGRYPITAQMTCLAYGYCRDGCCCGEYHWKSSDLDLVDAPTV